MTRLMTNSNSCTASFTQMAGIEALRGDQSAVERMRSEFKHSRIFVGGLNRIQGFCCLMPQGAFYVFPNITGTGWKSKALADALLDQAGVAALSGTSFGKYGEGYVRFSVANSIEMLHEALERIERWVRQICKWEGGMVSTRAKLLSGFTVPSPAVFSSCHPSGEPLAAMGALLLALIDGLGPASETKLVPRFSR